MYVQNENEVYETTHLTINGDIKKLKIYGNNIKYVKRDYQEKIIGKSVKINMNGSFKVVTPIKTAYSFSEEFKKLKTNGNISTINGDVKTVEVRS